MAGTARVYSALSVTNEGVTRLIGSLDEPIAEKAIVGTHRVVEEDFVIAPGSTVTVWNGTDGRRYTFFALRLLNGAGYAEVYELVDTPVDPDTNSAPSGSVPRWREIDLSCAAQLVHDTDVRRTHPDLNTETGSDGNGRPSMATQPGSVEGRHYRTDVHNRSTTDSIKVRVTVIR